MDLQTFQQSPLKLNFQSSYSRAHCRSSVASFPELYSFLALKYTLILWWLCFRTTEACLEERSTCLCPSVRWRREQESLCPRLWAQQRHISLCCTSCTQACLRPADGRPAFVILVSVKCPHCCCQSELCEFILPAQLQPRLRAQKHYCSIYGYLSYL